ncbi:MAG: DUF547 domain-containing protein [Planctomycetota bacterium]|nr:MAG: DUF547 domain-containing protein [Planctomycetota bacterium]
MGLRIRTRFLGIGLFAVLVGSVLAGLALRQPAAAADIIVGETVGASQRIPLGQIDHTAWDELLHKYVDSHGMVAYAAWKRSASDQRKLLDYLNHLSRSDNRGTKPQLLAFWINAYNALTVYGILREYPTSSIRNHTAKLFGYNIWKHLKLRVAGNAYSLEDIEHKILRKMGEPRIHFAIVCASIGCPRLLNEAYVPERLDQQLTENAKNFFGNREKFRYDAASRRFWVSPILQWFAEDFGADQAARLRTIAPYLPDETSRHMALAGKVSLSYLDYDWSLNDRK